MRDKGRWPNIHSIFDREPRLSETPFLIEGRQREGGPHHYTILGRQRISQGTNKLQVRDKELVLTGVWKQDHLERIPNAQGGWALKIRETGHDWVHEPRSIITADGRVFCDPAIFTSDPEYLEVLVDFIRHRIHGVFGGKAFRMPTGTQEMIAHRDW